MLCYHTSEMSCPYFEPLEPHPRASGAPFGLLPLGGAWTGACHADPAGAVRPEDSALHRFCNLGYARGSCPRFPADDPGPDAVRFTISGHQDGSLRLYYVLERDHRPFAHGPLEYAIARGAFTSAPAGNLTARQAAAYASNYLRRQSAASGR